MKGQNDMLKRQDEKSSGTINDIRKEVFFYNDIFVNALEKSFFVYSRKIEKIVTAIYLVTDVMEPELPLTKSLRLESLDLLNACYQLLTGNGKLNPTEMTKMLVRLEHVTSLVSIGRIAHHISEMNAQVLIGELQKVTQLVSLDTQELSKKYTSYLYPRATEKEIAQPILSHGILDDNAFDDIEKAKKRQNDIKTTLTTSVNDIKLPLQNKSDIPVSRHIVKTTSVSTNENNDRKQSILNVIRSHKNASMQDIQKFVTGCSDKTLQREIVSLITAGVIRKIGDKRWATYHIV